MDTSKIIKGVVSNGRYTVTAPIVKEDYGLYLKIEGVELPSTYEVDFSNSENSGTSVTMIGNADGVLIPHQFIDTGKDIFAFLYHVGADFGRTVYKFRIPNKCRPDRTEEEPTPEEQSTIDQLIGAMNTAVAQTAQDVVDAEASAQAAGYDADRAEEARSASLDYAEQAEASAISAEQSATASANSASASANSASQSAQIKADVEELVDDAQASADASERSASNAYTYATSAERSSVNASSSAQSASGYASQAQSSANTASAKAQDASQSATTASGKASESAQSASQALTYKTDAESAKTASQTAQGLAESARDLAQGYAEDAQGYANDAQASAEGISASASQIAQNTANILKAFPTDTASGAVASFSDGADDLPLKSLVVNIDPVQDLSQGDPSPTNICPISGWTSVDVEQRGVNVWDEEWELGVYGTSTGNPIASNSNIRSKSTNYIPVIPSTAYYFKTAGYLIEVYQYRADKSYISKFNVTDGANTVHAECRYIRFDIGQSYGTTYNHDISINYPSTDHSYHPYTGRSITIPLGQTVYGGKLDVLSGVLTVEKRSIVLDNTKITRDSGTRYHVAKSYIGDYLSTAFARMNKFRPHSASEGWNAGGTFFLDSNNLQMNAYRAFDTRAEFIEEYGELQLCYTLATPIEIQLPPQQVNSLLGQNNIWADTGDTEVEYRADTKLYIERLTAPDSADMIADANITSGKYFMVGNNLYKATANIANGSAIIVGTNCTRKSLPEALNEINA